MTFVMSCCHWKRHFSFQVLIKSKREYCSLFMDIYTIKFLILHILSFMNLEQLFKKIGMLSGDDR